MADNRMKTKTIAYDAVFCAMVIVFSMMFGSMAYFSRSILGIVIASIFGIYFFRKSVLRCIASAGIVFVLLIAFQGLLTAGSVYLPNLIIGCVLSYTYNLSRKGYYIVTASILSIVSCLEFVIFTKFLLGMDIYDYVIDTFNSYSFLNYAGMNKMHCVILYVIIFSVVMAVMKSIIAQKMKNIIIKRLPNLI